MNPVFAAALLFCTPAVADPPPNSSITQVEPDGTVTVSPSASAPTDPSRADTVRLDFPVDSSLMTWVRFFADLRRMNFVIPNGAELEGVTVTIVSNEDVSPDAAWEAFLFASVLEREDRVRAALTAWTAERVLLPWNRSQRDRTVAHLASKGLSADQPLDLDLVTWALMSGGFQVGTELPFPLPPDLVLHLAVKGAACWSIQSNAQQHPLVNAVYERLPYVARLPRFVP